MFFTALSIAFTICAIACGIKAIKALGKGVAKDGMKLGTKIKNLFK